MELEALRLQHDAQVVAAQVDARVEVVVADAMLRLELRPEWFTRFDSKRPKNRLERVGSPVACHPCQGQDPSSLQFPE
ncbi:MAG TPA: hypothetical protein VJN29_19120 [Intrasporangium sp.]|uniref:hypothetical protein n=1 Tax=Intrasporangium sp. TaxID=1925024 RepID=UPI002B47C4F2|nr:hypothetical protein [Intrasporangium sp.]HKX69332.1 hypothetical protein [Intrasporangium sp.]